MTALQRWQKYIDFVETHCKVYVYRVHRKTWGMYDGLSDHIEIHMEEGNYVDAHVVLMHEFGHQQCGHGREMWRLNYEEPPKGIQAALLYSTYREPRAWEAGVLQTPAELLPPFVSVRKWIEEALGGYGCATRQIEKIIFDIWEMYTRRNREQLPLQEDDYGNYDTAQYWQGAGRWGGVVLFSSHWHSCWGGSHGLTTTASTDREPKPKQCF